MVWNGKQFFHIPYWQFSSIPFPFHTKNLPFHTKIFFDIPLILPDEDKFRPEATRNLHCTFATLSAPLQVVSCNRKQYDTKNRGPRQLTANQLTASKLTADNADWLKRVILKIFLLSPEPSCPNPHFVTKSLQRNQ